MRFRFVLLLELLTFEVAKPLLGLLHTLRKGLYHLIKIAEQLVLISHSCLELDDPLFHDGMIAAVAEVVTGDCQTGPKPVWTESDGGATADVSVHELIDRRPGVRHFVLIITTTLLLTLLVVFPPWGTSYSQPPTEVVVTNIPKVQQIEGKVSVVGVVRQAELKRRVKLIVPSVAREDVTSLIQAEAVTTDGFSELTVSLHGEARGTVGRDGTIGVVLVPDEPAVLKALDNHGVFHFPIEVKAGLTRNGPSHFDVQQRFDLGFASYKVYLYNSSDRTADVNVYLYLTQ